MTMAAYAEAEGLSLEESVAYADSSSDLPMLEAVGHPVAVNPEAKLATIARKRGWHVENWARSPGAPRHLLPFAPRPARRDVS
jgi:phosphoserine phosphatase